MRFVIATAVALIFASGCPADNPVSDGPVETCTRAGEKCRIARGQLGVCTMEPSGGYHCLAQH